MLERYFVRPATVDRIRSSWIAGPIEQYVSSLAEQGYAARNVFRRVPILVQFGEFARERGAMRIEALPAVVDAFVARWAEQHGVRCATTRARNKVASEARNPVEQMLRLVVPEFRSRRRAWARTPFEVESDDSSIISSRSAGSVRRRCSITSTTSARSRRILSGSGVAISGRFHRQSSVHSSSRALAAIAPMAFAIAAGCFASSCAICTASD